jgi:hypothetical protein
MIATDAPASAEKFQSEACVTFCSASVDDGVVVPLTM